MQWLRRCATSRSVPGSITGGVTGFSMTYSFRPYHGPGVDSTPSENEYQEHFLGVKAAVAWGWQPHHLHVPNVMKSGSLNLLEPSGPHRACYRTGLPLRNSTCFGQLPCPKHVELPTRINLEIIASVGFNEKSDVMTLSVSSEYIPRRPSRAAF